MPADTMYGRFTPRRILSPPTITATTPSVPAPIVEARRSSPTFSARQQDCNPGGPAWFRDCIDDLQTQRLIGHPINHLYTGEEPHDRHRSRRQGDQGEYQGTH